MIQKSSYSANPGGSMATVEPAATLLDANLNTMGSNINEINGVLYRLIGGIDRIVGSEPDEAAKSTLSSVPANYIERFAELNDRLWRLTEALNYQLNRLDKIS